MKIWGFIGQSLSFQFSTQNEEQGRSCGPAQTGALVLMPIKCLNTLWSWNPALRAIKPSCSNLQNPNLWRENDWVVVLLPCKTQEKWEGKREVCSEVHLQIVFRSCEGTGP